MHFYECDRSPIHIEHIRYGKRNGDNSYVEVMRGQQVAEIFYKYPGDSVFFVDDIQAHLTEGTVGYLPPLYNGRHMRYDIAYRQDSASINLFFQVDPSSDFPQTPQFVPCGSIPGVDRMFEQLVSIWNQQEIGYYGEAMSVFYKIMTTLRRHDSSVYLPEAKYKLIESAITYLNQHCFEPDFEVYSLAELSGISESYFKRLFVLKFGTTPKQYVIARRMRYARDLLIGRNCSITRAAELCGYGNICYFSQAFHNFYGVSPQNFIKSGMGCSTVVQL